MSTPFSEIYDLMLVSIRDYKIDKIYSQSVDDFNLYLFGFLLKAIPKFTNCKKNLADRDITAKVFNVDLDDLEKDILSNLMVIEWLEKEINDVNQFSLHLNDTDFKHYSEAQNLREKSDRKDRMRETISLQMTEYGLKNISWKDWSMGNFYVD